MVGYSGPTIDAHHHMWALGDGLYPWLAPNNPSVSAIGDLEKIRHDYGVEDFRADCGKLRVTASVHVEALAKDPLAELDWLESLDKTTGIATRYVASASLTGDDLPETLANLAAYNRVVGLRSILSWHPDPQKSFVDDPELARSAAWLRGAEALARAGLHLELMMYPYQARQVADVARRFPMLGIVINHCGSPIDRDEAGIARWREGLALLAQYPNVSIKVSNPGVYVPGWSDEDIVRIIRDCIESFGHERCMYGSDLPVSKLHMAPCEIVRLQWEALSSDSPQQQAQYFHDTAHVIYRFN